MSSVTTNMTFFEYPLCLNAAIELIVVSTVTTLVGSCADRDLDILLPSCDNSNSLISPPSQAVVAALLFAGIGFVMLGAAPA
jgi:hypothetical protein